MSARLLLSRTAPRLATPASLSSSSSALTGRAATRTTKNAFHSSSTAATTRTSPTLRQACTAGLSITLALGVTSAASPFTRTKYHFDAFAAPQQDRAFSSKPGGSGHQGGLDPDLLSQFSKGSVTGFLAGLLLSVFSKTLVLLGGIAVVLTQVAAKYGIDIVQQLKLKQRIGNSKVLSALERDPAFKLSFGFFFAMSAFIGF